MHSSLKTALSPFSCNLSSVGIRSRDTALRVLERVSLWSDRFLCIIEVTLVQ